MKVSLTEDIKSASELKKEMKSIFNQIKRTGRPVVVTVNGKPDMVVMDVNVFEKNLRIWNLALLLAESEEDIRKGRVRPARAFLKSLKHAKKVSS